MEAAPSSEELYSLHKYFEHFSFVVNYHTTYLGNLLLFVIFCLYLVRER